MSHPLCRASSKTSIMPTAAIRRSDTRAPSSLRSNTPGRWPIERHHTCPLQGVHSIPLTRVCTTVRKYVPNREESRENTVQSSIGDASKRRARGSCGSGPSRPSQAARLYHHGGRNHRPGGVQRVRAEGRGGLAEIRRKISHPRGKGCPPRRRGAEAGNSERL